MKRGSTLGRTCTVEGCDRKHYGRGYCEMHYRRVKTTGSTDAHDWRRDPAERFVAMLVVAANGCWLWQGTRNARGYGMFSPGEGPRMVTAHRWSYTHHKGPIPAGKQVGHTCHDNTTCAGGPTCPHRPCVNPDHLEAMTNRQNVLAGNRARGVVPTEESIRRMMRRTAERNW